MNMELKTDVIELALDYVLDHGRCPDCLSGFDLAPKTYVFETSQMIGFQQKCDGCGGVLNVTSRIVDGQIQAQVLCNCEEWNHPTKGSEQA